MSHMFPESLVDPAFLPPGESETRSPGDTARAICIRAAGVSDVAGLSAYFTGLSTTSRNKRFMGARADIAAVAAECLPDAGRPDHFTLLAEVGGEGRSTIVGETRYAYDAAAGWGEFAISVADAFQRRGLGLSLMTAMEMRAIDLGHEMIAGDAARTNAEMRGLARKAGFSPAEPNDWQSVHFVKHLTPRM
ncbi:GNAT family N-acetyltransferase [Bradyrhizobium sp.]|uniref:GNAT family N-acetyltransferase n=1 Tax=Bradyrhizobium sp. TaxID=376 RepID=UPI0039E6075E